MSAGCDVFHYSKGSGHCAFSPNNAIKNRINPINKYQSILKKQMTSDELVYLLDCSTPQENILVNSDFFTHTHLRMVILTKQKSYFKYIAHF